MKFIDEVKIVVRSGHGGAGAINWCREKFRPRGGPDGGNGGRGGDVIFVANPQLGTLLDLHHKSGFFAPDGSPGGGGRRDGPAGEDLIIQVPVGTRIVCESELLVDLDSDQSTFVSCKGGRGGKGNAFFKTSVNQAPDYSQPGEEGQELALRLELKLIADVGVIGYPNVGKSTLISRISAAKPKIADYAFTTLVPNLGVVRAGEQSFVVADIPGLIPGAHKGQGLGIRFLKHIERTSGFIHLIDVAEMSGRDPLEDFDEINRELEMYDKSYEHSEDYKPLASRSQLVVLNKIDASDEKRVGKAKSHFTKKGYRVHEISAVCGHGLKELIFDIGRLVSENKNSN